MREKHKKALKRLKRLTTTNYSRRERAFFNVFAEKCTFKSAPPTSLRISTCSRFTRLKSDSLHSCKICRTGDFPARCKSASQFSNDPLAFFQNRLQWVLYVDSMFHAAPT